MNVLVVDDDEDLVSVLKAGIERAGHTVRTAGDGFEALAQVQLEIPDAILMDLMMPKLDGASTYKKLKANPATAKIPIVILTGFGHLDQFTDFLKRIEVDSPPATRCLEKPASFLDILAALNEAVKTPH